VVDHDRSVNPPSSRVAHRSAVIEDESPAAGLIHAADRAPGGFAWLHLGSVAHHLAHHTRTSLAIAPAAGADVPVESVVVGVDGSAGSLDAVTWCARVAASARAEVVAVGAFDRRDDWTARADSTRWRETAEAAISREWTEPLRAADVSFDARIVETRHPVTARADTADTASGRRWPSRGGVKGEPT
jgi:nucleotide-binding universal stress UspA family protein